MLTILLAAVMATSVAPQGRVLDLKVPRAYAPLLADARYKGAHGGRGSAKSHFFAERVLAQCVRKPGTRFVCVREIQRTLAQSVKKLLEDKIKAHDLSHLFNVKEGQIDAPGDGVIIFQGMQDHTAESIKSLEGFDGAWVEEAQTLSERSLTLLRPTIRNPGSELWFSWNPRHPTDPIDLLLRGQQKPPGAVVVKTTYADNPWFPEVLRKEMEWDRSRDIEKYEHVWLGEYEKHAEGRVFKNWRVEDFDTPADAMFLLGGDWGYSVDPAVLVRCWVGWDFDAFDRKVPNRKLYVDHEAYQVGVEIDYLPNLFDTVPGSRENAIIADSARPETISYLNRHGFPKMVSAIKGKDSVKEGIIFLQNFDIIVHPRCVRTIIELGAYSFKLNPMIPPGQPGHVTNILQEKENHVIDSLRYAVERMRSGAGDWKAAGMSSAATW